MRLSFADSPLIVMNFAIVGHRGHFVTVYGFNGVIDNFAHMINM